MLVQSDSINEKAVGCSIDNRQFKADDNRFHTCLHIQRVGLISLKPGSLFDVTLVKFPLERIRDGQMFVKFKAFPFVKRYCGRGEFQNDETRDVSFQEIKDVFKKHLGE